MMTIDRNRSVLLVVDMQERLLPAIDGVEAIERTARFLVEVALLLGVPVMASEQYRRGLGITVAGLARLIEPDRRFEKIEFSALRNPGIVDALARAGRDDLVVLGAEAHVCVMQTVLDRRNSGLDCRVVVDGVGSRRASDRDTALRRMSAAGATLVTAEMVAFEWMGRADIAEFKAISALIKAR